MTKEAYPLAWPDGRPRTLIGHRKERNAWKKTTLEYYKGLESELKKLGARNWIVSSNVQPGQLAAKYPPPRDPGVAVWFMRPPAEDDFSWQEILGITNPDPTVAEIEMKFRELSKIYHPDKLATADIDMFKTINMAKDRATAWVTGVYGREHEMAIECDKYKEVKWNIKAICVALNSLRRIEECGASGLLERAFKGFEALPERTNVTIA